MPSTKEVYLPSVVGQPRQGMAWGFDSYMYTKSFCITEEILKAAKHKAAEWAAAQGIEFRVLMGGGG